MTRLNKNYSLNIYIPIWIDLKESTGLIIRKRSGHLHSNMDRFERAYMMRKLSDREIIYIPIWIDLKAVTPYPLFVKISFIYIPIWIDLKGTVSIYNCPQMRHLHSNMDRFESRCNENLLGSVSVFTFQYG